LEKGPGHDGKRELKLGRKTTGISFGKTGGSTEKQGLRHGGNYATTRETGGPEGVKR